jgi:hypothetical protein
VWWSIPWCFARVAKKLDTSLSVAHIAVIIHLIAAERSEAAHYSWCLMVTPESTRPSLPRELCIGENLNLCHSGCRFSGGWSLFVMWGGARTLRNSNSMWLRLKIYSVFSTKIYTKTLWNIKASMTLFLYGDIHQGTVFILDANNMLLWVYQRFLQHIINPGVLNR